MRIETGYSSKVSELNKQISFLEGELVRVKSDEFEEIIEKKLYIPMDRYQEEFDKVRREIQDGGDGHWCDAITVELVVRTKSNDRVDKWGKPFLLCADGADGCEWPYYDKNGRFYWNTYNCGILQWEEEYNSYIWWRHHTITYVDILGFVSIEEER